MIDSARVEHALCVYKAHLLPLEDKSLLRDLPYESIRKWSLSSLKFTRFTSLASSCARPPRVSLPQYSYDWTASPKLSDDR